MPLRYPHRLGFAVYVSVRTVSARKLDEPSLRVGVTAGARRLELAWRKERAD